MNKRYITLKTIKFIVVNLVFLTAAMFMGGFLGNLCAQLHTQYLYFAEGPYIIGFLNPYGKSVGKVTALGAAFLFVFYIHRKDHMEIFPPLKSSLKWAIGCGIGSAMLTHLGLITLYSPPMSLSAWYCLVIIGPLYGILAGLVFGGTYYHLAKIFYHHESFHEAKNETALRNEYAGDFLVSNVLFLLLAGAIGTLGAEGSAAILTAILFIGHINRRYRHGLFPSLPYCLGWGVLYGIFSAFLLYIISLLFKSRNDLAALLVIGIGIGVFWGIFYHSGADTYYRFLFTSARTQYQSLPYKHFLKQHRRASIVFILITLVVGISMAFYMPMRYYLHSETSVYWLACSAGISLLAAIGFIISIAKVQEKRALTQAIVHRKGIYAGIFACLTYHAVLMITNRYFRLNLLYKALFFGVLTGLSLGIIYGWLIFRQQEDKRSESDRQEHTIYETESQ